MVLPGHLAGGYIATSLLLAAGLPSLSTGQMGALIMIGTLVGDLPDIDILRLSYEEHHNTKKVGSHREYFTHAPLFWLVVSLVIVVGGFVSGSIFTQYLGWIVLASTWSHLLFDSIDDGVMWLWPFSKKRYSLLGSTLQGIDGGPHTISYYWNFITRMYPKYATCYAEILVTIVAIWMLMR